MDKATLPGRPAQPDEQRLVLLGVISKPQGIKGGLRLVPQFDDWNDFENLKTDRIFLKQDPVGAGLRPHKALYSQVKLTEFLMHQRFLVVFFEEAPDINAAEGFRSMLAYVYEEELWDLPAGKYYGFQLEGLEVYDGAVEQVVGKVKQLRSGVQDYLVVAGEKGEFLAPYVPEIVKKVDLEAGRIWTILPPGLDEIQ